MSFQLKGWDYTESQTNLKDPDDLPLVHAQHDARHDLSREAKRVLMIGLGGGSISTYLGRHMPDAPSIPSRSIPAWSRRPSSISGSARASGSATWKGTAASFSIAARSLYDIILLDAYHGGYVPFHLLTKEFYTLVKQRLTPDGAAAFNVHDGTKLYASTLLTLAEVFPTSTSTRPAKAK